MSKVLYIVATPIGNLDDLSPRAVETLKTVDYILAEDTRHSKILLNHFLINTPCISLHKFNEREKLDKIMELFEKNLRLAMISDAGTPAISDPGALVVDYSLNNQIKVVPIPGPSAMTALLSASGIQKEPVTFIGFLPYKKTEKKVLFGSIFSSIEPPHSLIFFESPQRILTTLEELSEIAPDSTIILGRELTKVHEEILKFKAIDYPRDLKEKGEFTVLIRVSKKYDYQAKENLDLNTGEPRKIASTLGNYLNINQKEAYNLLVKLKQEYTKQE